MRCKDLKKIEVIELLFKIRSYFLKFEVIKRIINCCLGDFFYSFNMYKSHVATNITRGMWLFNLARSLQCKCCSKEGANLVKIMKVKFSSTFSQSHIFSALLITPPYLVSLQKLKNSPEFSQLKGLSFFYQRFLEAFACNIDLMTNKFWLF